MSIREAWEFRVNGIRSSGDTFSNWEDACTRMFRALNALHFETTGEERDANGRKEHELISVHAIMRHQRPLGDISVKCIRHGKPWVLQVNRLPWGSAPSGFSNRYL